MAEWFDGELVWQGSLLEASLDIRDPHVRELMMRLGQELRQPGFASQTMVELIAAQLALELHRYRQRAGEARVRGGLAPWRLRLIDERLREEREMPTLAELAALCKLSVRQLTRGFQASRGLSIGQYVANSRLEHARRLLATEASVKSIAYSLGFASPSGFCCAFRRAMGETPGDYRRRLQHGG
jgi:AraC family transcriptional regulator